MSSGLSKNGTTFETIFAAYSGLFGQAAATGVSGGGLGDLNAQFDPLSAGTAAAATGVTFPLGDANVYFAALGSTSLMPGIKGLTMATACRVSGGSGTATSTLTIGSGGWIFVGSAVGGVQTLTNLPQPASGVAHANPTGAAFVQVVATLASGVAGSFTNTLASLTAIGTGGSVQIASTGAATPGAVSNYQLVIKFFNASSVQISTTTCNLVASHGA